MSRHQENIALAQSVYDCGFASDWAKLETLLCDDFEIVEPAGLSFGGAYRGKDALERVFGSVLGALQPRDVQLKSMTANESQVVSLLDLVFDSDDGDFIMPVAELFEIEGGKIKRMLPYFYDTAVLDRFLRDRAKD
ncbi:nuclear transport factor 2 family protein [Altererythrobacter arenosus]|uniref:Nuclear transport factor 2 family protein n=1 Tax=Altererythrobacter arenosus TaxID=3032592 RepID=A0ABY8FU46_9SPHN|nr:nuclear transport factor 2 family protein [Altererythrobacter sp. CAU 1644]WFL77770.1 nuclear transport factor 2 family protein [Altererythrobacter sp. CAU 1644]